MSNFAKLRAHMVKHHIESRGVRSPLVLEAMGTVPREEFLPLHLREYAYEDTPLPIGEEQTISQPYIVAFMTEALGLSGGERVLEIGAGSGYAAAILSRIAGEVYTVERIGELAARASEKLSDLGYKNVHLLHGDGTRGWEEHAPYDAIIVAAGGPKVPTSLKTQLAIGGRLVTPVGADPKVQELVRVTRLSEDEFKTEDIADVRFVPLLGEEGWAETRPRERAPRGQKAALIEAAREHAEPFASVDLADLGPILERVGDARVVLIGEATHGTAEFYRMREQITRALITKKQFSFVAIEGDWPDAARIDRYVRHFEYQPSEWTAFARFPTWMWRNEEVRSFVEWLRSHNADAGPRHRAAFHGLDLYSLHNSIRAVLDYLDDVDPHAAQIARERYGCLTPWQSDPATYGRAALTGRYRSCEKEVASMLAGILARRREYALSDGERYFDAVQNARLVTNAERYYRIMYYGSRASWNLRDSHMFETLNALLYFYGKDSKAVVWAHNSHVGDASATEMAIRGEHNIGQLCRQAFGERAYLIGFGTDRGTVAAASDWDEPMQIMAVRQAHKQSYERQFHVVTEELGESSYVVPMKAHATLQEALRKPLLERAIGVIYRPETELASHYFQAILPRQFDEYIWFDETNAVTPLTTTDVAGMPETYPFGL